MFVKRAILPLLWLSIATPLVAAQIPASDDLPLAIHVLNRAAYGPTPASIEQLREAGARNWIEQQLTPQLLDDSRTVGRLRKYRTISLSSAVLWKDYYQPVLNARRDRKKAAASEESSSDSMMAPAPRARNSRMLRPQQVMQELSMAKLDRAIHSERQLEEIMVDFWSNHFNVFAGKSFARVLVTGYERDTIRPHTFGKFEDLLMATAKSPAMLVYLDNARSAAIAENRPSPARPAGRKRKQAASGLNENYARELLELHTLGVGGGYSQHDVTELARAFTGWTLQRDSTGVRFRFREALHDTKPKKVLTFALDGKGGIREGEMLIRKLALHPSTARFISRKLAQRFVSDAPPQALVDRVAKRFLESGGDIRETLRALLLSDEFLSLDYAKTKIKTPFEYIVSAVRAAGRPEINLNLAIASLRQMGQPLYLAQPPTGYSESAEDWVTSSGLVERLNFAVTLASKSADDAASAADIAHRILGAPLSQKSIGSIEKKVSASSQDSKNLALALVLGSPEFQRQ